MRQDAPSVVNSTCKREAPLSKANAQGGKEKTSSEKSLNSYEGIVNTLPYALEYAKAGFPVFPCQEKGERVKAPYTKSGFKEATMDEKQIREWWGKHPHALIGVPMGEASGLWCLDIDRPKKEGGPDGFDSLQDLMDKHGALPSTASQTSASGGKHYFFKYAQSDTLSNRAGTIAPKIDIRAQGGYVIMAPSSIVGSGSYHADNSFIASLRNPAHAPSWLIELAHSKKETHSAAKKAVGSIGTPYGLKALTDETAIIESACEGERNDTLNSVGFRIGQLVGSGQLERQHAYDELIKATTLWGEDRKSADTLSRALSAGELEPRYPEQQKEEGKIDLTEDLLALAFTSRYEEKFSYCHDTGAWFCWNGQCWQKDKTRVPMHAMRELCREMNPQRKAILGKVVTASGALKFAACDPKMAVTADGWDTDPMLIGTPGGVVDLRTGILSQSNPALRITKLSGVAPSENVECPKWLHFLDEATDGDKDLQRFMQQVAGYCLTGDTREHALFFIYGPGGNGKSVFLNILTAIMAEYATTSAMTTFTASNFDQHPTDLAMLKGARLVSVSETDDGRAWAESRIKQLTGGDKITARFMRQDFFEFVPQFKLLIVGNHQPILRNVDAAARRRFNIIPFVHTPSNPDTELESKLKAELPGIMRWAIQGCLDWQANGLVRPAVVLAATEEYFESQDLFGRWFEEKCDISDKTAFTETSDLYASWSTYAHQNGEESGAISRFGPMIGKMGFPKERIKQKRGFRGVALRKEEMDCSYSDFDDV